MSGSLRRSVATILFATTLAACGGSQSVTDPASTARACGAGPDFRASSLPGDSTPRPGPEILYAPAPPAPQLQNTGVWQAAPILVSGATAYRCGEFLYQDWLFDDRGAAGAPDPADPFSPVSYLFSPKAGTLTYPTDPVFANNAADLVELRMRLLPDATAFRITLNTLQDAERTAFTIALGDSTGAREWPFGAGVSSPASHFVTVHGASAELREAGKGATLTPAPEVDVDVERRQITLRIPHAAWQPQGDTLRLAAGVGLWDPEAGSYLQPGLLASEDAPGGAALSRAALFNIAFRAQEPMTDLPPLIGRTIADAALGARVQARWWRERAQANALASGDISDFAATVELTKLRNGVTDDSAVPKTGHINRIFASRLDFGQGVDYDSECGGISAAAPCNGALVGQLQPYALYVPEKPAPEAGYGMSLLMHSLSGNYNQYLGTRHAEQYGERGDGHIVVTPAGRGPDGFYFDASEADVFEVWADVARHYRLDPEKVAMSGVSMGGIGSFRLAARYPDLFGRIAPIVAGAPLLDQLPSLHNVPVLMWNALLDELQPVTVTEETVNALRDAGLRYEILRFETWDHLTASTYDNFAPAAAFLGEARVDRNPMRVRYVLNPAEDSPDIGLVADKAYWLSQMQLRDPGAGVGTVDARSEAFGRAEPELLQQETSLEVLTGGNHEPAPYTRRTRGWAPPEAEPERDRLHLRTRNIARLTVDLERAGLSCSAEIVSDSDGPVTIERAGC